jgi:hypothetical protein
LPPGTIASRGPAYFYYGQTNTTLEPTELSLVRAVPRHFDGQRFSVTVDYPVDFPSPPFRFAYDVCWKSNETSDGVGLPGRHHCGQDSVSRGEYLG